MVSLPTNISISRAYVNTCRTFFYLYTDDLDRSLKTRYIYLSKNLTRFKYTLNISFKSSFY